MLLVLSQYSPEDTALEQRIAKGRAELFIQPASTAAVHPLPPAIRRRADAIVHVASTTFIDGTPGDYPRCQIVVRSGVGYDKVDLAGWTGRRADVGQESIRDELMKSLQETLREA